MGLSSCSDKYPFRLNLIYLSLLNNEIKIKNDPISNLIKKYDEIKIINNDNNFLYYLFLHNKKIHKILYSEEKIITINDSFAENFDSTYYLILLINSEQYLINYEYSINYIKKFNENFKNQSEKFFNLIKSKISIDLINNFKNSSLYDEEEHENVISEIEEKNRNYINENINVLRELDLDYCEDDIENKNIIELYEEIIVALIKKEKLVDYDYSFNLLNQMHLNNLPIYSYDNDGLSNDLIETVNLNNDYINKYTIKFNDDMNSINKINFYYLLLKFIFKESFYIYKVPLLYQAHKKIISILREKEKKPLTLLTQKEIIERVNFIINKLCDSKYYINKYISKEKNNKNLSNFNDFKLNILKKSEAIYSIFIEKNSNPKIKKIEFICNNKKFDYHEIKSLNKKNNGYPDNNIRLNNNFSFFIEFLENFENIIIYQINDIEVNNNFNLHLQFETKEDSFNNDSIYKMNIKYYIKDHQIYKESLMCEDENILLKKNDELKGFYSLMKKIDLKRDFSINSSRMTSASSAISSCITNNSSLNFYSINRNQVFFNSNILLSESNIFKITSFEETICKLEDNVKFFVPLHNEYFFSCGNSKNMVLFNSEFDAVKQLKNLGDNIYNISEKNSDDKNIIELIVCYLKYIYLITIKIENNDYSYETKKYEIPNIKSFFCKEVGTNYIIAGLNVVLIAEELFNDSLQNKKMQKISSETYRTGISLNNDIIVLISFDLIPNGSNKLSIIDIEEHKVKGTIISEQSFTYSENCACSLSQKDKIIFVIGCKSYNSHQKNGIFLGYMDSNIKIADLNLKYKFYDTNNFEVYCFSKIYECNNPKKKIKIIFFFAGGFDLDKRQGVVRLYKLIEFIDEDKIKIKFLQEIEIDEEINEEFQGFNMPVNNITQLQHNGKMVITTSDGGIYLFSKPNIDFYINLEKEI